MAESYDAIVVGGGAMGTAAAHALAQRGRHTVLLERFEIAHARGSSGGPTRIFRLTYDHPDYVRMARLALDAWHELEDAADERLLITTAGLDIGPDGRSSAAALEAAGEPFEYLAPEAVTERWSAVRVEPDAEVFVQEDGGVIMCERTVRAQARLATAAGVTILERTPVERIEATGIDATVHTAAEAYRAPIVVVTAGPWAAPLLRTVGVDLPLVPSLEQVTYFELDDPSPLPTVIDWTVTPPSTPYTVPNPEEPGAFKIAFHMSGRSVDADDGPFEPDPERVRRAIDYAPTRYAAPRPTGITDTCLYTNTPDEHFVLDRQRSLVIGSPCSGHGFKFTPLIGRILADLATARPAPIPIERFLALRFG
jgi:sarcosine oxidase